MRSIRALFLAVVAVSLVVCCCEPQPRVIPPPEPPRGRRGRRRRRHRRTDPHARSAPSRRGRPRHPAAASFRTSRRPTGPSATPARGRRSSTSRPTASRCPASSSRTRTCAPSDAACGRSTSGARPPRRQPPRWSPRPRRTRRPAPWILGRGWNQTRWSGEEWPNRMQLDQAAPGNPVALTRVDGHALWVSTRALELAGINKATVEPAGRRDHARSDGRADGHPRRQRDGRGREAHRAQSTARRGAGRLPARPVGGFQERHHDVRRLRREPRTSWCC